MSGNSLVIAGLCLLAFYFTAEREYGKAWRLILMGFGYILGAVAMRAILS